jgi:hypothetical protein
MDSPVIVGIAQTEAQIRIFLMREASGMYVLRVMVRSVMMAMARIEKSAAYVLISARFLYHVQLLCYHLPAPTIGLPSH